MDDEPNAFRCPDCGLVSVDEDGCCVTCGADAPAVFAKATHWGLASVWSEECQIGPFEEDGAEVCVRCEVPMNGDEKVPLRGNRYWPCDVELTLPENECRMDPTDARALAALLLKAADKAEAIDAEDEDQCGHWWPCDCARSSNPKPEAQP